MSTITVYKIETKADLQAALVRSGNEMVMVNGRVGTLQSVQREDGSGNCFNIKLGRYDAKTMRFVTETLFLKFTK